jgi:hypothetical protein
MRGNRDPRVARGSWTRGPDICVRKRSNGRFTVLQQTIRKRLRGTLQEVKAGLRRRMHRPIREQGAWLRSVVGGHVRYYGEPMNTPTLRTFRRQVGRLWLRRLPRRGQCGPLTWARMQRHIDRRLPPARVCHPYPLRRPAWRYHLRWEPDAGNPHVRIRGRGAQ